jgi:hypothetical protein
MTQTGAAPGRSSAAVKVLPSMAGDAEQRPRGRGHDRALQAGGLADPRQRQVPIRRKGNVLNTPRLFAEFEVVGIGDRHLAVSIEWNRGNEDDPFGVRIGKRVQQDTVDNAEYGGVCAHPQGQNRHDGGGERRRFSHEAQRKDEVVEQEIHSRGCAKGRWVNHPVLSTGGANASSFLKMMKYNCLGQDVTKLSCPQFSDSGKRASRFWNAIEGTSLDLPPMRPITPRRAGNMEQEFGIVEPKSHRDKTPLRRP